MAAVKLQLPVIQNWSCHNCGGCCREHLIEITPAEKTIIDQQNWTAEDGIPSDRPLIVPHGRNAFRLNHAEDGGCVFLDQRGLCRIHAKFGEPAKPLACRLYPYVFHPSSERGVTTSLRFSCPSVVRNLGMSVVDQQQDLQSLAKAVVGKQHSSDPPLIHNARPHGAQQTSWADFHRVNSALRNSIADDSVHFAVRLLRTLAWLDLIEQSQFQTIKNSKLDDLLRIVTDASVKAQPDNEITEQRPSRIARILFRQLVAQSARHDTILDKRAGVMGRLRLLNMIFRFVVGRGKIPVMPGSVSVEKAFSSQRTQVVRFADLDAKFQGRTPEIDALFARYFDVKLSGLHYCGPANFQMNLVEGFRSMALMYPVTMWLARRRAVEEGQSCLLLQHVSAALAIADHNYAFSPALGNAAAKKRIAQLAQLGAIGRLIAWYSR